MKLEYYVLKEEKVVLEINGSEIIGIGRIFLGVGPDCTSVTAINLRKVFIYVNISGWTTLRETHFGPRLL